MYSWQSSKQYRPIQVSGTKCWPKNYHPATVTVRCSNISHQDNTVSIIKRDPAGKKCSTLFDLFFVFAAVVSVRFIHLFNSNNFGFVSCSVLQTLQNNGNQEKKGFGSHSSICDFETCTLKPKKKGVGPLSLLRYAIFTHHLLHQGCHPSTDVLSHRQVTKETL